MPESSLPGDEPEIRPEVVQAIFSAMADNNSAKLNDLLRSGVTTGEYLQAMNQYGESPVSESPSGESAHVTPDNHQREFEAIKLLAGDRQLTDATGWPDLFDGLTPERVARLRDLYHALPEGARAEYDRRYGR
jgi:hypothetical protein